MKRVLLFCVVVLLAGCSDDPAAPMLPGVEPEVINSPDTFEFQLSAVDNYTGSVRYSWENTGTMANVDQSSTVDPGQAVLTLIDADGTEVYASDLATDGSFMSVEGVAGTWEIRVAFLETVGDINFRTEKRTP